MSVREQTVARVLADSLDRLHLSGSGLVVDDDTGIVKTVLQAMGLSTATWHRHIAGSAPASVWPPAGTFDVIAARLPASREAFEMVLHAAGSRLAPGGRLLVCGANDEGIRSAAQQVQDLFGTVETLTSRRHCRVLQTFLPERPPDFRADLHDWRLTVSAELADGQTLRWVSYPGVFAHGRLDEGTCLLLDALPDLSPTERVLDYGCGVGVIAMVLQRRQPQASIDLLDDDVVAVQAARENMPEARTILGDGWTALEGTQYDLIVSNPPIHRGKEKDFALLTNFIEGARKHLRPGGKVIFVVQRTAPAARLLHAAGATYQIAMENNRFRVWQAQFGGSAQQGASA